MEWLAVILIDYYGDAAPALYMADFRTRAECVAYAERLDAEESAKRRLRFFVPHCLHIGAAGRGDGPLVPETAE